MTKHRPLLAIAIALACAGAAPTTAAAEGIPATIPSANLNPATGSLVADLVPGSTTITRCTVNYVYSFTGTPYGTLAGVLDAAGDCTATIPAAPLTKGHWVATITATDTGTPATTVQSTFDFFVPGGTPAGTTIDGNPTIAPSQPTTPPAIVVPPPTRMDANATLLACARSAVAITDLGERSGRVRILGVTSPANAGEEVAIEFATADEVVSTAIVAADGSFRAIAPLPARAIRNTNRARYRASLGAATTPWLKLARRLQVSGLHTFGTDVEIGGKLVKPLVRGATVTVTSQSACGVAPTVIGQLKVASDGRFHKVITIPPTASGFIVRLTAKVRSPGGGQSTTYSIARPIQVR